MSETMISAIISAVSALIGAIIGGVFSYIGVKTQLRDQNNSRLEEEKRNTLFTNEAIIRFLRSEIKYNYSVIGLESPVDFWGILKSELEFIEYERIKYKMIETPSEMVILIIELYEKFYDLKIIPKANKVNWNNKMNEILEIKKKLDIHFEKLDEVAIKEQ